MTSRTVFNILLTTGGVLKQYKTKNIILSKNIVKIQTFSIIVGGKNCNANCPYCVSRMTGYEGMVSVETRWDRFTKACHYARINDVSTVILTGKGEPTLYPEEISKFLKELQEFNFPFIELQTNGLLLLEDRYDNYLKEWRELGLSTVSLSSVHFEQEKNREIFCPAREHYDVGELVKKLHGLGYSVRLSCLLMRQYIDSSEKVKKLIDMAKDWSVEQLSLRELALSEESECEKTYDWSKSHKLTEEEVLPIKEYITSHGVKVLSLMHGGEVYDINGQNVCITNALTKDESKEELRQIIFFPDGHLRYDWQYMGAILL